MRCRSRLVGLRCLGDFELLEKEDIVLIPGFDGLHPTVQRGLLAMPQLAARAKPSRRVPEEALAAQPTAATVVAREQSMRGEPAIKRAKPAQTGEYLC